MSPRKRKNPAEKQKDIRAYKHADKQRLNNPQVGLVHADPKKKQKTKTYSYDPHLDPTLQWAGKAEQPEVEIDTVSLNVHERIDPKSIIYQTHKQNVGTYQHSLFEEPFDERPIREEVSFYEHENAWANRLVAGDSALVMNSLLEKEGLAGQVQAVYFDPPYGIQYGSNFQPNTNKRDVKDGKDQDLTSEPEMIKAYRDTWELGVHSYLTYMRDRLMLARKLLSDTGSCFVQISDENLHHLKELMDEVFGSENFMTLISFRTKIPLRTTFMPAVADYIIWYAKNKKNVKFHRLYTDRKTGIGTQFSWVELSDGKRRKMTSDELRDPGQLPQGARPFRLTDLVSAGRTESCVFDFNLNGKTYSPSGGKSWKTNPAGIKKLIAEKRIMGVDRMPAYVFYADDYPVQEITNLWSDTQGASDKKYVVQTAEKVIQRCLLMTTEPGDLVLDPTCGSGTTAYVSEQWGRRWITCDTSRISLQIAKQRLMTAGYSWYKLARQEEGVAGGFAYRTAKHITLGSITRNEPTDEETLYDQPEIDKSIQRVSGPFTVEAVPSSAQPKVKPTEHDEKEPEPDATIGRTGETSRQEEWRSELLKSGIRAKGGKKITLSRVELMPGTRYIHADAETTDGQRVAISFGPTYAPLDQTQVELAMAEAEKLRPSPKMVVFAAFQVDPEAGKDISETKWPGVNVLQVEMKPDLLTKDLRKQQSSNDSFWLIGQPDVAINKTKDGYAVSVNGFDYYNPATGEVDSGGKKNIAMWMLDTDYDGRSIFPTQVFFPMGSSDGWKKLAKNLKTELDTGLLEKFEGTESIPFKPGDYKQIAVKIIDDRGIESFCIKPLPDA